MTSSSLRQVAARLSALLCVSAVLLSAACGGKHGKGDAGADAAGSGGAGSGGAGSGGAGSGGAGASGATGVSDAGSAGNPAVDATDGAEVADGGSTVDADASGGDGGVDRLDASADASDAPAGVVCTGGRSVRTDQEYQALVAEHCAEITGSLSISTTGGPTITLSPALAELTKIGGDLRVHAIPGLKSMAAFSHLESVGGTLAIYTNDDLTSLDGLEHVRSAKAVQLNATNPLLSSVSGLANLETVETTFILYAPVTSLQGWHLKSVTNTFFIAGTHLTSLAGLEHVTSLGGLEVGQNPDLASLGPLLTWPKGAVKSFTFSNNAKLPQCQVDAFTTAQGVACITCTNNNGTGTCN
jgi:hypothetical protein